MYNFFHAAISFILFGNKLPWKMRKRIANGFQEKSREYAERGFIMDITEEGFDIIRQRIHKKEAELENLEK